MQPESVSMSPVMWVAQPSSTAMGMSRRPYPYQISAAATATPARSATWPRAQVQGLQAGRHAESVISSASPALPPQSARKWQDTQARAVKTATPRKECVACRCPPLIRPNTQATASDTKPSWPGPRGPALVQVRQQRHAAVAGQRGGLRDRQVHEDPRGEAATPPDRACECPSISPPAGAVACPYHSHRPSRADSNEAGRNPRGGAQRGPGLSLRPARTRPHPADQGVTPDRFNPITLARIRPIDTSLAADTVSPRMAIPIAAVPAAPMPVQTA